MGTILAIDPGNIESGYVVVEHDGEEIRRVLKVGKEPNRIVLDVIKSTPTGYDLAIEMIAGMGMAVGAETFDTCYWIGRFWQYAIDNSKAADQTKIYRREEKLDLCGSLSAKDANIRQALVDRYAPGRISARARRRIPASSTASRRICGRLWQSPSHILTNT